MQAAIESWNEKLTDVLENRSERNRWINHFMKFSEMEEIDRRTSYYIEQYFSTHNVRFIAVTDQFDTADADNLHGGIMLPLKNMINEAYALDIGRKIKAQQRQAMQDGELQTRRSF